MVNLDAELAKLDKMIADMNKDGHHSRGGAKKTRKTKSRKTHRGVKTVKSRKVHRKRGGRRALEHMANDADNNEECGACTGGKRKVSKKLTKRKVTKRKVSKRKGGAKRVSVKKALRRVTKKHKKHSKKHSKKGGAKKLRKSRKVSKVRKTRKVRKVCKGGAKKQCPDYRHFTLEEVDGKKVHDLGYAKLCKGKGTPLRVAKKLLRTIALSRKLKGDDKLKLKAVYYIRETTQGSNHKIFGPYHGHYERLSKSEQREARGGIIPKFKTVVKLHD